MKRRPRRHVRERSWAEIYCFGCTCLQLLWPKVILRKWLNISARDSDFSADESDSDSHYDHEEMCGWERVPQDEEKRMDGRRFGPNEETLASAPCKSWRRKSETLRAQYINTKGIRICVGTWNVGGKLPPDDLDIQEWLNVEESADIYVLGLQEIVPLNAGNIFGAEDSRPASRWESIIRRTLNRTQPAKTKFKCYSDPPSPSRFNSSDDVPAFEDEILLGSDSDGDEVEIHTLKDQSFNILIEKDACSQAKSFSLGADPGLSKEPEQNEPQQQNESSFTKSDRLHGLSMTDNDVNMESVIGQKVKLTRRLSSLERIGLSWPEQPLNLLPQHTLGSLNSKSINSVRACNSSKSGHGEHMDSADIGLNFRPNLDALIYRKKRSVFVRKVSKQMIGIHMSIWVCRSLGKHIQNLRVSTVGVGVMGYIGNKGSISVSMSIYQTFFCFICSHLTSGEKDGDDLRRNTDVQEIHHRTQFNPVNSINQPRTIYEHERIIWLGDLNYRINLSYEETRELISKREWLKLAEMDQLKRELKKGRAFDGWSEGVLEFPPTYKYELNSEKYFGNDLKLGRRTPAWCDRILSFGKGMRLLNYDRSELKFSDHRPVTAVFMAEVEVFCHRKLQRALTFTDAEIEESEIISGIDVDVAMSSPRIGEVVSCNWSCHQPHTARGVGDLHHKKQSSFLNSLTVR